MPLSLLQDSKFSPEREGIGEHVCGVGRDKRNQFTRDIYFDVTDRPCSPRFLEIVP